MMFSYFQAKGKIVVFNERWVDYGTSVIYRTLGAAEVAKVGGVASLIRSVTPFSIYSPHTGWQNYENGNLSIGVLKSDFYCSSFCWGGGWMTRVAMI